ncbi:DUF6396 domain-containing protein [Herbaspirillum huttiense F1]|uniref:SEL1-like repeat protein n=1 Tax=Herbaspirillum huttiense TaxID=863372 RepID=UPI002884F109|nr:DUF6396 domain-containing protein [Herbaspirillum huttiense]MDT0358658.1 DUF6396 domain-containing protein [Herbaspirillum huttiense F1]
MDTLPRNMKLTAFDPHTTELHCQYEMNLEKQANDEAEQWFREGLAVTSYDLWPDDRDYEKAALLWMKAAEKDHWRAMLNLASLHLNGTGVERNTERAVQLVEKAMLTGAAKAFDLMGTYHMNGTGVTQDATRAYAFWWYAAQMGNPDALAYLGDKLNASYDDPKGGFWGNKGIALEMLECGYKQENGSAAYQLGQELNFDKQYERALNILHEGVKFGSEESANKLFVNFDHGRELVNGLVDQERADRYAVIADMLRLNPDLRLPNLDKVLPLPPAILPYWDGKKKSLINGAKPVKAVSPDDIQPSPASLRQGRAHIPDGFVLPDEPQGGHLIQHEHTDATISGYPCAMSRANPSLPLTTSQKSPAFFVSTISAYRFPKRQLHDMSQTGASPKACCARFPFLHANCLPLACFLHPLPVSGTDELIRPILWPRSSTSGTARPMSKKGSPSPIRVIAGWTSLRKKLNGNGWIRPTNPCLQDAKPSRSAISVRKNQWQKEADRRVPHLAPKKNAG